MGFRYDDVLIDTTNELHQTVKDMISDDYKERFKAEYKQLIIRLERLNDLLNKYNDNRLSFKPATPMSLLEKQYRIMVDYERVLYERAIYEGINLD
jgi:hypothetical protein